ncbi:MAG: hypothetical protein AAB448_02745 [Patescibacteria group bacterium]
MTKLPTKKMIERQGDKKNEMVEQLKRTPIVQVACEKVSIARATYYRWIKDDTDFRLRAEAAIDEGNGLVSDMAESQMINMIRNGNLGAITFWLKHRHRSYGTRVDLNANVRVDRPLTPEEEEAIGKALTLGNVVIPETIPYEPGESE